MRWIIFNIALLLVAAGVYVPNSPLNNAIDERESDVAWARHTIDGADREAGKVGADGVRIGDANGDGLPDVATGWEQGGAVRVCMNPGPDRVTDAWQAVTVGTVSDVEDAAMADLDGDGYPDVFSCAEGRARGVYVHWSPGFEGVLDAAAWQTSEFSDAAGRQWMFAIAADVDVDGCLDIILGSKGENAVVAWLRNPGSGLERQADAWELHVIQSASWIMSIRYIDIDGDGCRDVLVSDRKGAESGVYCFVHPGEGELTGNWERRLIGAGGKEAMFLDAGDVNGDQVPEIVVTTRLNGISLLTMNTDQTDWSETEFELPYGLNLGKGIAIADINLDGRADLISTGGPQKPKPDVMVSWMEQTEEGAWVAHRISDDEGHKFDRIEMIDLDGDGDLDLLTCEENDGLGVFWYENPAR
ncbi:MAG: VCBS repeat-containing protein [Planctomycetota bacterium]